MADFDYRLISHIQETLIHKTYVIDACIKMSNYLISENLNDYAIALLQRANIHDNSKLVGPELELLSSICGDKVTFTCPESQLSEEEKKIIREHWKNNRHHPEHFENVEEMTELDIIEMVCDWYARSLQYKTDFLTFVKVRQETRFHFPINMFKKIYKYCEILDKN